VPHFVPHRSTESRATEAHSVSAADSMAHVRDFTGELRLAALAVRALDRPHRE
jgi:hypothetical protein